jgi:glutamine phosphoribosylpyrophosphate amidotransferase
VKDIFQAWLLGLKWPSLPRNDRTPCLIQFVDAAAPPSLLSQLWVQTMQARLGVHVNQEHWATWACPNLLEAACYDP